MIRKIKEIDEEKCDDYILCIPVCPEGANNTRYSLALV